MKYRQSVWIIISCVIIVTFIVLATLRSWQSKSQKRLTPIRIGWQTPLATQGQVVQVLKRTNLLEMNGLDSKFISFSYGGPQSEAALAGQLDVMFVGDQPAINLIARGGKWKIVSRLFYTKVAIMVPLGSPIQNIANLQGKTVASPFGSVAHREVTLKEQSAGLIVEKDVNNINLDILEISNVVQKGGEESWGNIDAIVVWEPSASLFELNKLARGIDYTRTLGVIAVSDEFITKYPESTKQLLIATLQSWAYVAAHVDQVNRWYIEDARLSFTPDVLVSAANVEPNYTAKSFKDIDLSLNEEHITTLENGAKWSFERGFAKTKVEIRSVIANSHLTKAMSEVSRSQFDTRIIKVRP